MKYSEALGIVIDLAIKHRSTATVKNKHTHQKWSKAINTIKKHIEKLEDSPFDSATFITKKEINKMKKLLSLNPEDRVSDYGDELTNKIMGILLGFYYNLRIRDGWIDIITTRQSEKEIRELIKETWDTPEWLTEIDWDLLREQKTGLSTILSEYSEHDWITEPIDGIIHLIDHIQDSAVNVYGVSEEEIFGIEPSEKHKNFIHGMLYAVQELVSQGMFAHAADIIRNSNISRDQIEECQKESGYLTGKVTQVLDAVFD